MSQSGILKRCNAAHIERNAALLQPVPQLHVYLDQKLGANGVDDHVGGCHHANTIFRSRLWDVDHFGSVGS
jgi:hypothetical protein